MKRAENVVERYKHFIFIDKSTSKAMLLNSHNTPSCYKGTICKINDIPFQLRYRYGAFYLEPLTNSELDTYKIDINKINNTIMPNETIGVLICTNDVLDQYEYTIPAEITNKPFVLK